MDSDGTRLLAALGAVRAEVIDVVVERSVLHWLSGILAFGSTHGNLSQKGEDHPTESQAKRAAPNDEGPGDRRPP